MSRAFICMGACTAILIAGCAPPTGSAGKAAPGTGSVAGAEQVDQQSKAVKRITAAIRGTPASLSQRKTLRSVGSVPGLDALEELVHASLVHVNDEGQRLPQLAETVPSLENGQWKVFPDGRMETTWRIKPTAQWHDGAPLTTEDLLFTATVEQDEELGIPRYPAYGLIESIEARDRTVTVTWKQPYIEADLTFGYEVGLPIPRHLLEKLYLEDKATFLGVPYWSEQFIGTGPFRVKEWAADSHVVVQANDHYVLGRPKIDEIEVKFIPDPATLLANILAGVELTIGRNVSLEQALEVRDQWKEGRILTRMSGWMPLNPQFVNPNPPIVADLAFRGAMLEAIDRRLLMDSVMAGQGDIAHSFVSSDTGEYRQIESSIRKYGHDPRRASQTIEGFGYRKSGDGFFYDPSGQKLTVSIYTTVQNAIHVPSTAIVADFWQRLGIGVEQVHIPIQRARDREYRAQFPAFELVQTGNSLKVGGVMRFHSSSTPLPENRFQATGNNPRYRHPELDALIERYVTTVPLADRALALASIVRHQTENLTHLGQIFHVNPTMVSNRIANVTVRGELFTESWNAHEWEVR